MITSADDLHYHRLMLLSSLPLSFTLWNIGLCSTCIFLKVFGENARNNQFHVTKRSKLSRNLIVWLCRERSDSWLNELQPIKFSYFFSRLLSSWRILCLKGHHRKPFASCNVSPKIQILFIETSTFPYLWIQLKQKPNFVPVFGKP